MNMQWGEFLKFPDFPIKHLPPPIPIPTHAHDQVGEEKPWVLLVQGHQQQHIEADHHRGPVIAGVGRGVVEEEEPDHVERDPHEGDQLHRSLNSTIRRPSAVLGRLHEPQAGSMASTHLQRDDSAAA